MKRNFFGLIAVLAVAGAAVWYYSLDGQKSSQPPPQAALPEPPAVRHPIEPDKPTREPLPTRDESDGAMRDVLRGLFGKNFHKFFSCRTSSTAPSPPLTICLETMCPSA